MNIRLQQQNMTGSSKASRVLETFRPYSMPISIEWNNMNRAEIQYKENTEKQERRKKKSTMQNMTRMSQRNPKLSGRSKRVESGDRETVFYN